MDPKATKKLIDSYENDGTPNAPTAGELLTGQRTTKDPADIVVHTPDSLDGDRGGLRDSDLSAEAYQGTDE